MTTKRETKKLEEELEKIFSKDNWKTPSKEKVIQALNQMPHIPNKNTREQWNLIYNKIFEEIF